MSFTRTANAGSVSMLEPAPNSSAPAYLQIPAWHTPYRRFNLQLSILLKSQLYKMLYDERFQDSARYGPATLMEHVRLYAYPCTFVYTCPCTCPCTCPYTSLAYTHVYAHAYTHTYKKANIHPPKKQARHGQQLHDLVQMHKSCVDMDRRCTHAQSLARVIACRQA